LIVSSYFGNIIVRGPSDITGLPLMCHNQNISIYHTLGCSKVLVYETSGGGGGVEGLFIHFLLVKNLSETSKILAIHRKNLLPVAVTI